MGFRQNAPSPTQKTVAAPTKPAAATQAAKPAPAAAKAMSPDEARAAARAKYTGLKPPVGRPPFLSDGTHRVRLVSIEKVQTQEGRFKKDPWYRITVVVLTSSSEPEGVTRIIRRKITANSEEYVTQELLGLMMSTQGFEANQLEEFEAENEDWPLMLDAVCCVEAAEAVHGKNPLADEIVQVEAFTVEKEDEKTKATYTVHNYQWSIDPEREAA